MNRLWRAVPTVVVLAAFLGGVWLTGSPAHAAPAGVKWTGDSTCVPGSIQYVTKTGWTGNRIYDDAWLEDSQCVTTNGFNSITITSPAVPNSGTVVAYPSVRYGDFYTDTDPQSGLPLPVTRLGNLTAHVTSTGKTSGDWQSDIDAWIHPTVASIAHHHGTFELLVSYRYAWRIGGKGDPWIRIHRTWYRWSSWITCQRTADTAARIHWLWHDGQSVSRLRRALTVGRHGQLATTACDPSVPDWRIAIFWQVHQKDHARVRLGSFTWFLIHQGLLPRKDVLGDFANGTEDWGGGAGLTDSLTVTGVPAVPHLKPPGGGK